MKCGFFPQKDTIVVTLVQAYTRLPNLFLRVSMRNTNKIISLKSLLWEFRRPLNAPRQPNGPKNYLEYSEGESTNLRFVCYVDSLLYARKKTEGRPGGLGIGKRVRWALLLSKAPKHLTRPLRAYKALNSLIRPLRPL